MILVGLTGGIGSGKSTVINYFKELGITCYQADDEAKKLMNSDKSLIKKIKNSFGDSIYINIVHPIVNRHFKNYCKGLKDIYIIKEVAIIFETGTQNKFDKIILVRAPKEDRIKRIINRDKCSRQDAINRINNQIADDDKIDQCDFIIDNINLEEISNKVLKIHNSILNSI